MATKLSPFVYWGQSKDTVTLKVDLRNVENVEVNLTEENLSFSAQGQGVKGLNSYGFNLDFYLSVIPEKSQYRKTDLAVEFQIVKSTSEIWPRLTSERAKLQWLKIDFDKFMLDEESEETNSDVDNPDMSQTELLNKLSEDLNADISEERPSFTQIYLFVYNLFQFVGYAYICSTLLYSYIRYGDSAKQGAYETAGSQMVFCQIAAVLEVVHSLLKLVKTNVITVLLQVAGRNLVLFLLIMYEPRLQISPLCWFLFVVWSAVEVVRYPYYIVQILNLEIKYLTWLRYTIWIPLYPLGIITEAAITFQSISYFSETGFNSIELPNSANVAFYFPYYLMLHLVLICVGGSSNMKYMLSQRRKHLYGKKDVSPKKKFS